MKNRLLLTLTLFLCSFFGHAQIITTVAGDGSQSFSGDNGPAVDATLFAPYCIAFGRFNNMYFTDGYNNRIRKIDTSGIITTIAGIGTSGYNGDNIAATQAELYRPDGIICDNLGNVYFADALNNRVRKIDTNGIISTIAGNGIPGYNGDIVQATSAELDDPHAIALDASGNLYITDWNNHRIRKVNTSGIITTIAGTGILGYTGDNGPADTAEINAPYGIALDNMGNVYFADAYSNVIRKINTLGIITTIAGGGTGTSIGDNGPATAAKLGGPGFICFDTENNLYIGDIQHQCIRKILGASSIIITYAGNGIQGFTGDSGPATNAELSDPTCATVDALGTLYIADFSNNRIRRVGWPERVNTLAAQQQMIVYPNPSSGTFFLNIKSPVQYAVPIIIRNTVGEKIKETMVDSNQPTELNLSVPGIYFLQACHENVITTEKVIVQ